MNIDNRKITYICSVCKSSNVGKPINDTDIEIQCFDCGHMKKKVIMGDRNDWYALPNKPRIVEI